MTDAAAVLGYLDRLGGALQLDLAAAADRPSTTDVAEPLGLDVEAAAEGILQVACEQMRDLIRRTTSSGAMTRATSSSTPSGAPGRSTPGVTPPASVCARSSSPAGGRVLGVRGRGQRPGSVEQRYPPGDLDDSLDAVNVSWSSSRARPAASSRAPTGPGYDRRTPASPCAHRGAPLLPPDSPDRRAGRAGAARRRRKPTTLVDGVPGPLRAHRRGGHGPGRTRRRGGGGQRRGRRSPLPPARCPAVPGRAAAPARTRGLVRRRPGETCPVYQLGRPGRRPGDRRARPSSSRRRRRSSSTPARRPGRRAWQRQDRSRDRRGRVLTTPATRSIPVLRGHPPPPEHHQRGRGVHPASGCRAPRSPSRPTTSTRSSWRADGRVVACGRYVLIQVVSMDLVVTDILDALRGQPRDRDRRPVHHQRPLRRHPPPARRGARRPDLRDGDPGRLVRLGGAPVRRRRSRRPGG